jgi:hypothetical protein
MPTDEMNTLMDTTTARTLEDLRAEWDKPHLADPNDTAANGARTLLTRELAAAILAADLGATAGGMTVDTGGWSKERADAARAAGPAGSEEWRAALGAFEHATLTADGQPANRGAWCTCPNDDVAAADWIRYEVWVPAGCERHGFVHATCRKLLQTG